MCGCLGDVEDSQRIIEDIKLRRPDWTAESRQYQGGSRCRGRGQRSMSSAP